MRALPALLLALLLSGCVVPLGDYGGSSSATTPWGPPPGSTVRPAPQVRDEVIAGGDFSTGPGAQRVEIPFHVPNGTVQLLVRLTLRQGAAGWLNLQLASCSWAQDGPVAADGATRTWACGAPIGGDEVAALSAGPGLLSGRFEVVAQRCGSQGDRGGCFRVPP